MTSNDKSQPAGTAVSFQKIFSKVNLDGFMTEINELEMELKQSVDGQDAVDHLKKVALWGRVSTLIGILTAVILPNPISAFLISQGKFTRWTSVAHHVLHKGYDGFKQTPKRFRSHSFAKGGRRIWDWLDWIEPAAWEKEHNVLHHYRLGERFDPDVFEFNVESMRNSKLPKFLKTILLLITMTQWKWFYYAPSTIKQLYSPKKKDSLDSYHDRLMPFDAVYNPFGRAGRSLWLKSFLPYAMMNFILIPALFLMISETAAMNVFLTLLLAEIFTNVHTFLVIVPNHSGSDLFSFEGAPKDRQEFCIRQIVGSANYRCGGDFNDFLHGWLNYQIEHHLWPDMSMLQYQLAQPKLKAICEKYKVPYVQESVWLRFAKIIPIFLGSESMITMSGKQKAKPATA